MNSIPADWIKGHLSAANKLIDEVEKLLRLHHLDMAASELHRAKFAINRAESIVEKAGK